MTDPHAGKLVLNGAPSQYARLLPPPGARGARVDGRTTAELHAFAVRMAGLVNFYGLDGRVDGDWSAFFLSDPGVLEASLSAAVPPAAEAAVAAAARRALEEDDPGAKALLLRGLFAAAEGVARQADGWLRAARGLPGATARRAERRLAAVIADELAPALRRLHAWHDEALHAGLLSGAPALDRGGFSAEWRIGGGPGDEGRAERSLFGGAGEGEQADAAVARLVEAFGGAADALASVRDAGEGLAEAAPPGMQKPQVALFDAFARLFGVAQATLNTLVPRYAEFYYRRVLREPERGPVPDRVYLAFALGEDATAPARVPRGTCFAAGQDAEGQALVYAAERALSVTPAALARVRMLRALRGPLIVRSVPASLAPEPATALRLVSAPVRDGGARPHPRGAVSRIVIIEPPSGTAVQQVLATRLVGAEGAEAAGEEVAAGGAWPTFGLSAAGTEGRLVTEPAALGLAVASPELRLTGGRRFVALAFRVLPLEALGRLQLLAAATGMGLWDALRAVLELAWDLDLSTADGWLPVERYGATAESRPSEAVEASFTLGFELPAAAPAIVPLWEGNDAPPEPVPGTPESVNPAPGLPTLRARVRPGPVEIRGPAGTVTVYPLPFLDGLRVRAVEVRTRVRGLADVELANTDGPVDASAPFPVFGGTPAVGSYLELRSAELFGKVPSELAVTVSWVGLPPNADGFAGWYRDYTVGLDGTRQPGLFDNATFRGRWRVVDPGEWRLRAAEGGEEPVPLFRTRLDPVPPPPARPCAPPPPAPAGTLCTETRFGGLRVVRSTPAPAYPPAGSALRLELSGPPYAFGNDLYAVNVLNAVMEDIPDGEACAAVCEAEWQPLLDAATALAACAAPCAPADPLDSGPCTACVEAVRDTLVAAAVAALLRAAVDEVARERARAVARQPAARRPAALHALTRGEGGGERGAPGVPRACMAMIGGALALQACLETEGRLTGARLAECGAALGASYQRGVEACIVRCTRPRMLRYPNPPWLPQAERVTVDYSAGGRIHPGVEGGSGALYHLAPFGGWTPVAAGRAGAPLLEVPGEEASLLLGFAGLAEAQALPLLFQMEARGGAPPAAPPAAVAWSALDGDAWQLLPPGAVPADGTHGLLNPGIVALEVPPGAPGGTLMPGPERWLRASVASDADGHPWTVSIHPHALAAVWQDPGDGAGAHLAQPLPAGTITTAVEELPGIGVIQQPMPSFGGRPPETRETYQVRLGERLRHKERAVQPWDYERLVLERFPQLWMARALSARDAAGAAPGSTLVVAVAGEAGNESADTTVPRASGALLAAVQDFLAERASPFALIQVVNPVYVRVRVDAEVVFGRGPEGGDADRLNQDLVAYLSPWFYDAERAAREGRYAFEPDVSEFIQARPYVEALLSLSLSHDPPTAALEWYFLTSADRHVIRERTFAER